jgi:hypothetical protein
VFLTRPSRRLLQRAALCVSVGVTYRTTTNSAGAPDPARNVAISPAILAHRATVLTRHCWVRAVTHLRLCPLIARGNGKKDAALVADQVVIVSLSLTLHSVQSRVASIVCGTTMKRVINLTVVDLKTLSATIVQFIFAALS